MNGIVQMDRSISLWINGIPSAGSDLFWWALSDVGFWIPAYLAVLALLIWKLGWKRGLTIALTVVLTVVCVDQLANLVKSGVARWRPCYDEWMVAGGIRLPYGQAGSKFGFFSAHAGNSFGFATASYLGLKWRLPGRTARFYGYGVFLWATLVSVSRIIMGAHFLGDITVGALVGVGVGAAWAWAGRRLVR